MKVIQKNWNKKTYGYMEEDEWGEETREKRAMMGSEYQARLFRGRGTTEEFKTELLRFAFVKYHSGSKVEDGLEVSKAGERTTKTKDTDAGLW